MKIVCDADGLIKMNKAGILATLAQHARLFIGPEVFREVITAGKAQGYLDAIEIEHVVEQHMYRTEPQSDVPTDLRLPASNFGTGEREALALYESEDADAILSDDRGFLSALEMYQIPYVTPAAVVVVLCEWQALSVEAARHVLALLRPLIRNEQYHAALADLSALERDAS
jgi:predicted nucleic acid-binding protein